MHRPIRLVRCPLLIGRDDLLELVDRRLDEVVASRGQFLLLAGEAGIGKTRFLGAIQRKAEIRGFSTVDGAVAPQDRDVPASAILDLARSMVRLEPFAALGGRLLELDRTTTAAEHVRRRRLVMEVVELILASLPGPTMLSFQDLQWADDLSLEVIGELARQSRDQALLVTGDYRTEDAPRGTTLRGWRARLITQRIAEEIRLEALDPVEAALVTTLILDTGLPAPKDVAAAVYERTDGIPLHIEELLGALSADERADGTAIREATVPDTIEDAVIARLSQLSPDAQATARAGAVIGRCFVPEVLAGIMDVPPAALEAPLQELVDQFVLDPPGFRGLYDFRHQLLRDALYRTIPAADRRRFHARAGEFGARLEGASATHASLHYERAGLRREAFDAALAGARDAARLSAHREAFELYRRAVDNVPHDLEPGDRAPVLDAYAYAALAIEQIDTAEQAARDAEAAYRAAGKPVQALATLVHVYTALRRQGRPVSERLALIREVRAELEALPDDLHTQTTLVDLATYEAIALIDARALPEARALLADVRAFGDHVGDPDWAKIADWKAGCADVIAGDVRAGLAIVAEMASTAESTGWEEGVSAFRDASTYAAYALDYEAAIGWIDDGLRFADTIEQSHCAHIMRSTSAMVSWAGSDLGDAQIQARQAVADKGCRRGAAMARWVLGYVALTRGDLGIAIGELTEALQFGETSEEIELILPPLWGLAEVALQAGDADRAFALCSEAFARAEALDERIPVTTFVVTGLRAALQAGHPAEAATWLEACAAFLEPIPDVAGAALDHGRGLVALAEGSTGVARVALEAAVAGWHQHGRTWEETWARLDLAHCLIRSNRFAEAVTLTLAVQDMAARLGSPALAERAETLGRMARGHAPDDEPWRPLTAREFEVARLIGEGLTNAEIAESLGIAPKTASSHVEHILAKLGASRRAEVATWASHVQAQRPQHRGQATEPVVHA